MKSNSLSPEDCKRICQHMNSDHTEALFKYAKHYSGIEKPLDVEMLYINTEEMKLKVDGQFVRIAFDHKIIDSSDAHKTLVSMLNEIHD